jgi:tetratricopeptide (TPR) repeat protein
MLMPLPQSNIPVAEQKVNSDSTGNIVVTDTAGRSTGPDKPKEKNPVQATQDRMHTAILYAQAFTPDEVPEDPNGPLDDAFFYYASAQYRNAIKAIDSAGSRALTRGTNTFTPLTSFYAVYYKALSMMSLGNQAGAIPLLNQAVLLSPTELLKAKARWYLALAHLKKDKISSARNALEQLADNPLAGTYRRKAEKLLAALNK